MRWTQRDPVEQPLQEAGWNDYIYGADNPITRVDPNGCFSININWCEVFCKVVLGAA